MFFNNYCQVDGRPSIFRFLAGLIGETLNLKLYYGRIMVKDGSFLVLYKDKRKKEIFLVFRSDYPVWVVTGGAIERGESPDKAALRETSEETGMKVKHGKHVGELRLADTGRKIHLFYGFYDSGEFIPEFPGCKGQWFNIKNLPVDMTSLSKRIIKEVDEYKAFYFVREIRHQLRPADTLIAIRHPLAALRYLIRG
jgi:8-oxo-dGTP pyrophosphatase MutT (NUDIX family)